MIGKHLDLHTHHRANVNFQRNSIERRTMGQFSQTFVADMPANAVSTHEETQTAFSDVRTLKTQTNRRLIWVLRGRFHEKTPEQQIHIDSQPFTVGRHPANLLHIPNVTVSGSHAKIIIAGENLIIQDLRSTNGTLLNGQRLDAPTILRHGDILHFGTVMFQVANEELAPGEDTVSSDTEKEAIAQVQFDSLLTREGVVPCFQPVVRLDSRQIVGYEVLSRSNLVGLETPDKMFRIAAQRTCEAALSRVCRAKGMQASRRLGSDPAYYLNTHPAELNDELFESLAELRTEWPDRSIMLEVHESGVTSSDFLRRLREFLDEHQIGLAYDDFGAGQARLQELIDVPPDVLKFDIKLIRGLPGSSDSRLKTLVGLIRLVQSLDVVALAEGVESEEEASICLDLGFELAQGYLFGKGQQASYWAARK